MCKQGNSHDHIYLDQRARLFYSQMLAKGLFNKKSLSVSTWHMGWHHTWEKERCKSVFSHKLQSWKCFHIRCFLFLICCFLTGSDTWKFSPVNFLLLLQQGCSLENFACKVASSKQWKHLLLPTWYHRVLPFQQGLERDLFCRRIWQVQTIFESCLLFILFWFRSGWKYWKFAFPLDSVKPNLS